jgi:hypothetical protein
VRNLSELVVFLIEVEFLLVTFPVTSHVFDLSGGEPLRANSIIFSPLAVGIGI